MFRIEEFVKVKNFYQVDLWHSLFKNITYTHGVKLGILGGRRNMFGDKVVHNLHCSMKTSIEQ